MAANKVVFAGRTLVDLTGDTVSSAALAEGATAHDASGARITGAMPTSAVLYTSQTLSDAQKTQARTNIGAAPAGFGLGEARLPVVDRAALDTAFAAGWYIFYDTANPIEGYALGLVQSSGRNTSISNFSAQEIYVNDSGILRCIKRSYLGAWTPFEWDDPPMELGVEYRTTERYLGKPVYARLVDCGALPNDTSKQVSHGISNIAYMLSADCTARAGSETMAANGALNVYATGSYIMLVAARDLSAWTASYVLLRYTKSTD